MSNEKDQGEPSSAAGAPGSSPLTPAASSSDPASAAVSWAWEEKNGLLCQRGTASLNQVEFPEDEERRVRDYDWALNDPGVRQRHGGLVVAVRGGRVWGVGRNHRLAWEDARKHPDCPPQDQLSFVAVSAAPRPVAGREEAGPT